MNKKAGEIIQQKQPLYIQIYNDILSKINNGTFPIGSKLPAEQQLAADYGVSRITSKKAMDMLSSSGYISRTPGRGTFVVKQDLPASTPLPTYGGQKPLIGVVIERVSPSFGGGILRGIERECRKYGYTMALRCTYHDEKEEEAAISDLLELGVKGLIVMCVYNEIYNPLILKLALDNFPIVLADRQMDGIPIPCVCTNNQKAARELTDILFRLGHEQITLVAADESFSVSSVRERAAGVTESCIRHKKSDNRALWITNITNALIAVKDPLTECRSDIDLIKKYMTAHPEITGYIAISYDIARLIIQADRECEKPQGKQRQVVCFDAPEDDFSDKSLIHICQDQEKIGRLSIKRLAERIDGKETERITYVDYQIVP